MTTEVEITNFFQRIDSTMIKQILIILIHAFIGWALCGATMIIGRNITTIENALIIHAIAAPIFFCVISLVYFKKFHYTTPIQTAIIFTLFVIAMDFFIVAPIFEQSFEMFFNLLGTWIPFLLIFLSTLLTGLWIMRE
ncbi:MAG: hypothetical protein ACFFCZ_08430 [Promethearchaeota archaeon]